MTQPNHLSAQRTYDRRRARAAAETLANIPPNRWDDGTRQIVATLATISAPSRIDDLLGELDAVAVVEGPAPAEYPHDMPSPYDTPDPAWNSSRCVRGHQHSTADNAYACDLLPGADEGTVPRPAPRPYPQPRPRPDPDPRPRPEPHPSACGACGMVGLQPCGDAAGCLYDRAAVAEANERNRAR